MNIEIANLIAYNNGELPSYTKVGFYPLYYVTNNNEVLCPDCANAIIKGEADGFEVISASDIVQYAVNWESSDLTCKNDHIIESATLSLDDEEEIEI